MSDFVWLAIIAVVGAWGIILLMKLDRIRTKKVKASLSVGNYLTGELAWEERDDKKSDT
ncbi:hypothetical protein NA78x_004059 [Anatilimnocola sp. NA78]|uniref:hypothetical protein n=1 Tax=Anatilimnocola sp. NA78 TaxID=3415683 RepID=UPI003CE59FCD